MASRYEIVRWGPAPPKEPEITPPIALPRPNYPMLPETLESWIISQVRTEIYAPNYSNQTGQKNDLEILLDSDNSSFRALIRGMVKVLHGEMQRQHDDLTMVITDIEKQLNDLKDKI
jgi:hypothetical protein